MTAIGETTLRERYPVCLKLQPELEYAIEKNTPLSEIISRNPDWSRSHPYLLDLARIEEARYGLMSSSQISEPGTVRCVNPHLELLAVSWKNLPEFIKDNTTAPEPGKKYVLVLKSENTGNVEIRNASAHDLLALKIVAENIPARQAAAQGGISLGAVDEILHRAERQGLILSPRSRIRRPPDFSTGAIDDPDFFSSSTFTLQWHITQACDLDCRHCYDRSDRKAMTLDQALGVLDDFYDFCRAHNVFGQVSFTGGNPMLYPHFDRLYREAAERGFMLAVLGNPMPRNRIEKILKVQKPEFYQVSLEGLKRHNDFIRGKGHYERVFEFLSLLGELDIYRMVMLTLTSANIDQVLELAHRLQAVAELFTFNRLSAVGRGTELSAVDPGKFPEFLTRYMKAAESNPCMSFKENLFNLVRWQNDLPLDGGCAGYGCGAAFNFVALLPDGEVHACRKFPSPIGNAFSKKLADIYHGDPARRYRAGSSACGDCPIRPVCRGCPAVTSSFGFDIYTEADPYCFRIKKSRPGQS